MKIADAMRRIEELERKVKELEARPMQQYHTHYHGPQPQYYGPSLPMMPVMPNPFPRWNEVTCGPQLTAAQAQ